jgi:hypothetical protein
MINVFALIVVAESYTLARRVPTSCYPHALDKFKGRKQTKRLRSSRPLPRRRAQVSTRKDSCRDGCRLAWLVSRRLNSLAPSHVNSSTVNHGLICRNDLRAAPKSRANHESSRPSSGGRPRRVSCVLLLLTILSDASIRRSTGRSARPKSLRLFSD